MKKIKWKYLGVLILLKVSFISFAQSNIDSLKNLLQKTPESNQIQILIELSKAYKRISPQKTIDYANQALWLSKEYGDETNCANSYANIGDGLLLLGKLDSAEINYNLAFKIYDKNQDFTGLANSHLDLGNIKFFNASYDSAIVFYNKSIHFRQDLNDQNGLINLYNNLGAVYKKTGKPKLAIKALENSLSICDQLEKENQKSLALINLASIYVKQGEISKAMKYNFEALSIAKLNNDSYTESNAYTNFGNIYSHIQEYTQAINYNKKALAIDNKLEDWEGIITSYNNIGRIYLQQNKLDSAEYYLNKSLILHQAKNVKIDFETTTNNMANVLIAKGNLKDAILFLNKSIEANKNINDLNLAVSNYLSLAEINLSIDDIAKAEKNIYKAFKIINEHKLQEELQVYLLYSKLYEKKNDFIRAYENHKLYTNKKDSLLKIKESKSFTEIKCALEIQLKHDELSTLSNKSELQQETIKKQNALRNILFICISIILIFMILFVLNLRTKIKTNKKLHVQNEEIKHKNLEIKQKTEHLTSINKDLEKLSIAASKTDNAIIMFKPSGEVEWINEGFTRLYGYTLDDLIHKKGKTFKEISSNAKIEEIFQKAISEKNSQIYETDIISNDQKQYRIYTTLTPILNDKNEIVRFIAIDSDITKLKEVEKKLQELIITKDKFFSIIAHDLKNPFNSLMGLAQLLVHGFDRMSKEKVKYFHKNLYQISKNGYELLINLLEWSRSQMGTIKFNPEVNNLYALTEETFTLYNSKATQKEINLTNHTDPELEVLADKNMLKTILRNLVQNALKFTDRGGAIEISNNNSDEYTEIIVRDTGIGIEPENIKKLFRLDEHYTTEGTEDEMGTGLGLILCKEFIEKHNGIIKVESKVGFGSQFILLFPSGNH